MIPCFIDIEASGLGSQSYPIEVAWNDTKGRIHSYLIKPVDSWISWDPEAEKLHLLSRDTVDSDGVDVVEMCRVLRDSIGSTPVYSDAPELERFWLRRLFEAGESGFSPLIVKGVSTIPEIRSICYQRGLYESLKKAAVEEVGMIHRAEPDIRILMKVFEKAKRFKPS